MGFILSNKKEKSYRGSYISKLLIKTSSDKNMAEKPSGWQPAKNCIGKMAGNTSAVLFY
jgi:ABC-type sugar transport system ATPase subunit